MRRLRREDDVKGLRRDVTTFKYSESESNEELLISRLATIDLHHGPDSSSLPFTTLDVIGLPLTHRIRAELGEYYFSEFRNTLEGFSATRQVGSPAE